MLKLLSLLPAIILYSLWTYQAWKERKSIGYSGSIDSWLIVHFGVLLFLVIILPIIAFNQ